MQWTLRALNLELAQVRDSVSTDATGRMRLQWWRDGVDATYRGAPPDHPVLNALAHHLDNGYPLSRSWIRRMISARVGVLACYVP